MSESFTEQGPETFSAAREVNIPDLNVWRWQTERIASSIIGEQPYRAKLAHSVSRFFDNIRWLEIESIQDSIDYSQPRVKNDGPYDNEVDVDELIAIIASVWDPDRPVPPDMTNLATYCAGNLDIETGTSVLATKSARILDLDLFRKQLYKVNISLRGPGCRPTYFDKAESDIFKLVLLEVLELTHDGIIRTEPDQAVHRHLLQTLQSLVDFNSN